MSHRVGILLLLEYSVRLLELASPRNLYFPGWFRFKWKSHIQDGSRNFFYLVELTRSLNEEDMLIAQGVLQNNSFWAHTENIILAMLADERGYS